MARPARQYIVLLAALIAASAAHAEVAPRTPEQLQAMATLIVTGTVQRIYETTEQSGGYEHTFGVAEISTLAVEKGQETPDLLYARFWSRRWVGGGPPPLTGHGIRLIPSKGETVRLFLIRAADGGYDVVAPNGFQSIDGK